MTQICFFLCLILFVIKLYRVLCPFQLHTAYSISVHICRFVTWGTQYYVITLVCTIYIQKCISKYRMQILFFKITALLHTTADQFFNDESESTLISCFRVLKHPEMYKNYELLSFEMQTAFYSLRS